MRQSNPLPTIQERDGYMIATGKHVTIFRRGLPPLRVISNDDAARQGRPPGAFA